MDRRLCSTGIMPRILIGRVGMRTTISALATLALLAVNLNAQSPERELHVSTNLASAIQLRANAIGWKVVLTWTVGSTCGTTVKGTTVACKPNIYRCVGTTSACPSFIGAPPSEWSLISNTAASDTGTYTDTSTPKASQLNYAITDCATDTVAGWTGSCPSPGSPGTGSESRLSSIASVTLSPAAPR